MVETTLPIWNVMSVEIHSFCNRDCAFCSRYHDRSGIRKDSSGKPVRKSMPIDKIYSIIDQASELGFRGRVTLARLSEPLLDPRYPDIARYAKDKGMILIENTNGDVLSKDRALCRKLDGLVDTFYMGFYDCANTWQVTARRLFWERRFRKTRIISIRPHINGTIVQRSAIYEPAYKNPAILDKPCPFLDKLLIRWDGNVSLCCEDDLCEFNLGNAFHTPLKELWWSEKHISLVNDLSRAGGRKKYNLCSKCYVDTEKTDLRKHMPS